MSTSPSLSQLKRAVQIAEEIERLQTELNGILGEAPAVEKVVKATRGRKPKALAAVAAAAGDAPRVKRKYTMSPEAREKIAAAQKRRWAKTKRAKKAAAGAEG